MPSMMHPIWLTAVLACAAEQAQALRCVAPDPLRTFSEIAAAPEDYYVLYGELTFDEAELPEGLRAMGAGLPAPIAAQFRGKGLTQAGFTSDYISPVTLQIDCMANYCGTAQSGIDALYFVRADPTPVTMVASPCREWIFPEPTQAVLDQLTACMQGGC
ncbi:hypothetical protein [Yoonia sp. I 8.24]|uniref:hypothetical protein n=1 Tax=Yoonia sp. I 8.24 TaxID=1537229 RepID=UPI001EDF6921|nr:hypothetical protein [Yoonia sp. I 8.24]